MSDVVKTSSTRENNDLRKEAKQQKLCPKATAAITTIIFTSLMHVRLLRTLTALNDFRIAVLFVCQLKTYNFLLNQKRKKKQKKIR